MVFYMYNIMISWIVQNYYKLFNRCIGKEIYTDKKGIITEKSVIMP